MTVREYFAKYLYDHGMFESDATKCLEFAEKDELMEAIKGRWDDATTSYPPQLLVILKMSMDIVALRWIDDEHEFETAMGLKPEDIQPPWYRGCFVKD